MRIKSKPTPNPNALKFEVSGATLIDGGLESFHSVESAVGSALGSDLMALPGVESVMIVPTFVTVSKVTAANWKPLTDGIEQVIRKHAAT